MLGISRFVLGLGNGKILNKKYLTDYVNKIDVVIYSVLYTYFTWIGGAIGLIITFGCCMIMIENDNCFFRYFCFNFQTNPSWICLVISLILFFFILFFHTDPYSLIFNIYEGDCNYFCLTRFES